MKGKKLLILIYLFPFLFHSFGQGVDHDYELVEVPSELKSNFLFMATDMVLSPNQKYIAISNQQNGPIILWDWEKKSIYKEYEVNGYPAGSTLTFSPDGKFLLIRQIKHFLDFSANTDQGTKLELLDLSTGEIIFRKNKINDACFVGESNRLAILDGNNISIYAIDRAVNLTSDLTKETTTTSTKIRVKDARNCIAISPDGKTLITPRKLTKDDFKNKPKPKSKRDKNAQKYAIKYQYTLDYYDLESQKYLFSTNENYEIIFELNFLNEGKDLIVFSKANVYAQSRSTYGILDLLNAKTGDMKRVSYTSYAIYPDYSQSPNGKLFGLITNDTDNWSSSGSVLWYNYETGNSIGKFDVDLRFKERLKTNTKTFFAFLPDGKIIASYGNKLAYITIN